VSAKVYYRLKSAHAFFLGKDAYIISLKIILFIQCGGLK